MAGDTQSAAESHCNRFGICAESEFIRHDRRLQPFLTNDTVPRPRHCFQSFGINLRSAGHAVAEGAVANTDESRFNVSQQSVLGNEPPHHYVLGMAAARSVKHIRSSLVFLRSPVPLKLGDAAAQFHPSYLQCCAESLQ